MLTVKIERGRPVFLSADLHVGHPQIVAYCPERNRFLDDEQRELLAAGSLPRLRSDNPALAAHDEYIYSLFRNLPSDGVLILGGDLTDMSGRVGLLKEIIPCQEVYIALGNHDDPNTIEWAFGAGRSADRLLVKHGPEHAIIDHYAHVTWDGMPTTWMLHGHQHNNRPSWHQPPPNLPIQDICLDGHKLKLWKWNELAKEFGARRRDALKTMA